MHSELDALMSSMTIHLFAGWHAGNVAGLKPSELPLAAFDWVYRRVGVLIVFLAWGLRVIVKNVLSISGDGPRDNLWIPAGIYGIQALGRSIVYELHRAGAIFSPCRWFEVLSRTNKILEEAPHMMSDHILLSSSVISGLTCEATLIFLSLVHRRRPWSPTALKLCAILATILSLLVSFESFYTARYFHPPQEIVSAAIIGLILFQIPILIYIARLLQQHEKLYGGGEKESDEYTNR